jgi:hypothetical protein
LYAVLAVVVILGVFLVAFSRNQELNEGQTAASPKSTAPQLNADNWHSTFGVYICDHWVPNIPLFETVDGIDTQGDGVIDIRPYTPKASGNNATLGVFLDAAASALGGKVKISTSELQLPKIPGDTNLLDSKDWHNGDTCTGGKAGKVQFTVDGKAQKGDPASYKLGNGDYLDLAFLPASEKVPTNPREAQELVNTPTKSATTSTTTPVTTAPPVTTIPVTKATGATGTTGTTGTSGTSGSSGISGASGAPTTIVTPTTR